MQVHKVTSSYFDQSNNANSDKNWQTSNEHEHFTLPNNM
jgi:hypothetical protein